MALYAAIFISGGYYISNKNKIPFKNKRGLVLLTKTTRRKTLLFIKVKVVCHFHSAVKPALYNY
mgnify:CR=1